ncbi:MAG: hypothetical protein ACYCZ1_07090 [Candidatus Humimicrobiaceae bacterium]
MQKEYKKWSIGHIVTSLGSLILVDEEINNGFTFYFSIPKIISIIL